MFFFVIGANAQTCMLKGRIMAGNEPVEFANVILQTTDSLFISGGISDQKGHFALENINPGNYDIKLSGIGFVTKKIKIDNLKSSRDLGTIKLDSATMQLAEVVVKASQVIRQADKQIYLPNSYQVKASTNGVNILQQMKLSRLQVDPMRMTITSSNQGEVQLRINGSKADIQEIKALRPEDIQRIEYYDDPSLRFGENVAVVIDYIIKSRESGGYIGLDTQNSPHVGFGDNGVIAKFNHKKSEFTLNYWGMYRDLDNFWEDKTENFKFDDGTIFTRRLEGIPTGMQENHHYLTLAYSYQEPEKWSFIAKLRGNIDISKHKEEANLYPIDSPEKNVFMINDNKDNSKRPSIDLYFQRNFKDKSSLIFNVVGTYISSESHTYYSESRDNRKLTDIVSKINGDKYSVIGQAVYEKGFNNGRLSSGANFNYSYANNTYMGNVETDTRMHYFHNMAYAEYSGKIGKFNYRGGLIGIYGGYSQGDTDYSKFLISSKLNLGYRFDEKSNLSLRMDLNYWTPELSELSDVEQLIDSLQIRRGNPALQETRCFTSNLFYEYRSGLFYGNFNMMYQYQHHPMMQQIYRENNKFVVTTLNQPSWQKINPEIELKVGPVKDIVNFGLTVGMNYFDSKGIDYHHNYTNWYYRANISAMYKNFTVMLMMQNHKNDYYGEAASFGESYHIMAANYKINPNLVIGIMAFNPFPSNYRRPSFNENQYASSRSCIYFDKGMRIFAATLSWNISFGRKYKSVEQKIKNEDTKSGALKGSR